jgi:hypothetical protein
MKSIQQPTLGILSTIMVMVFSLIISTRYELSVFGSWVTLIVMTMVPVQIVMTLFMQNSISNSIDKLAQPINGIIRTIIMIIFGLIVFTIIQLSFEGIGSQPTPFSIMYCINTVITTFWLVVVFSAWPFRLIPNKILAGIILLASSMIISYFIFKVMYNFSDFVPAPFYNELLDPKGLFSAWDILSFVVTTLAVILAWVLLDFYPIGGGPENPVLRILTVSIPVLIITYLFWKVGINFIGDPVKFMVNITISLIFGEFIVLLMMETAPVQSMSQPNKGIILILLAIVLAFVCNFIYTQVITSIYPAITSGAPSYDIEMWKASAMLAITFPSFVLFSQIFNFWPFRNNSK